MKYKYAIFFALFLGSLNVFGQSSKDTLHVSGTDTIVIRSYNHNHQIIKTKIFVNNEFISHQSFHYNKFNNCYLADSITKTHPQIKFKKKFYYNGQLKMEKTMVGGKKHGKYITYYFGGCVKNSYYFKNNKRDSINTKYFQNGNIYMSAICKNGKMEGLSIGYWSNGKIRGEIIAKNNRPWTIISSYSEEGLPLEQGTLAEGNGSLYYYDERSILVAIDEYKNGKRTKHTKINSP
jgi:antitoxin component YwqK of YwqJK toxin-antitoxin module